MDRNARTYATYLVREDLRDKTREQSEALLEDLENWNSDNFTGIVRDIATRKLELKRKISNREYQKEKLSSK